MLRKLIPLMLMLVISLPVLAQENATPEATAQSAQVDSLHDLVGADHAPRRAVLSPNGKYIAWQEKHLLCIYTIDAASTHCAPMPEDYASVAPGLVWAANNSTIAFTQDFFRFFNEPDLYVYDMKADRFSNLTDDGSHESLPAAHGNPPADVLPTWSPQGSLYWWRSYNQPQPTQSIYHFAADNTPEEIQNLTLLIPGPYSVWQQPAISPDGSLMAFIVLAGERNNPGNGVYTVNLKNGAVEMIASLKALRAGTPAWANESQNMPISVDWSGSNLVVTLNNYQFGLIEPANAVYIALPSKQITPLFDYSAYPTKLDFVKGWDAGQPENAAILRTGIVSGDGKQFLFLHGIARDSVGLSSLPLPPDGSIPTLLATTDRHIGALEPVNSVSADGTHVLLEGKLFSLSQ